MKSERRKISGREKDESSIRLLGKLQDQLYSSDASNRRRAAFNLSWMQEDGLDILRNALFGDSPIITKNAAAYGLRKMHGRMKKTAFEVFEEGLKHRDSSTRETCRNALQLLDQKKRQKTVAQKHVARNLRIKEITKKSKPRRKVSTRRTR